MCEPDRPLVVHMSQHMYDITCHVILLLLPSSLRCFLYLVADNENYKRKIWTTHVWVCDYLCLFFYKWVNGIVYLITIQYIYVSGFGLNLLMIFKVIFLLPCIHIINGFGLKACQNGYQHQHPIKCCPSTCPAAPSGSPDTRVGYPASDVGWYLTPPFVF